MPVVNRRNADQNVLLGADFQSRRDHIFVYSLLHGLLATMEGHRAAWIYNEDTREPNDFFAVPSIVGGRLGTAEQCMLAVTSTAGAPASIANPNPMRYRHGWGGSLRLGFNSTTYSLWTGDVFNLDISMAESHVIAARRGITMLTAMLIPPNFVNPVAGPNVYYTTMSKWEGPADFSYFHAYTAAAGFLNWCAGLSTNGAAAGQQIWYGTNVNMRIPVGSANYTVVLCGASIIPGGGCYLYYNSEYEYRLVPQLDNPGLGVAGTIFRGAANFCIARMDDLTVSPYPWWDGYFIFSALLDTWIDPALFRALYETVKPVLGYNTDFGGS